MDNKNLRDKIRNEVIAEWLPTYQSAMKDLDTERRIIAEKEKIYDFFFKYFIDKIAIDNAKRNLEDELKQNKSWKGGSFPALIFWI